MSENTRALLKIATKIFMVTAAFALLITGIFAVFISTRDNGLAEGYEYTASQTAIDIKDGTPSASDPDARRFTEARVNLDGVFIPMDEPMLMVDGRVFLPLRALGELIGAETYFDSINLIAAQKRGNTLIETFSGSPLLIVNGSESVWVDAENHEQRAFVWYWNNRMYLPVRQVCTVLGLGVDWDGDNDIIYITSSGDKPERAGDTALTIEEVSQRAIHIVDHDRQQEANLAAGFGREREVKPANSGTAERRSSPGGDWIWNMDAQSWERR